MALLLLIVLLISGAIVPADLLNSLESSIASHLGLQDPTTSHLNLQDSSAKHLSVMVSEIIEGYEPRSTTITLTDSQERMMTLVQTFKQTKNPNSKDFIFLVDNNNFEFESEMRRLHNQINVQHMYVINYKNLTLLENRIHVLRKYIADNIVVFVTENQQESRAVLHSASELLNIISVYPMHLKLQKNGCVLEGSPVAGHSCRCIFCGVVKGTKGFGNNTSVYTLDIWSSSTGWIEKKNLFPPKIYNMHGMPVRAVAFQYLPCIFTHQEPDGSVSYSGIDINLITNISEILNFELTFVPPTIPLEFWGKIINGSLTGIMRDVLIDYADIGLTCPVLTFALGTNVQASYTYMSDARTILTPLPTTLPQWKSIIYPFDRISWGLILVTMIVLPLTYLLISDFYYKKGLSLMPASSSMLFDLNRPFLKEHIHWEDKIKTLLQRVVFAVLTMSAGLFIAIYEGVLMAHLISPRYEPPVDTWTDLIESGLPLRVLTTQSVALFNNPPTEEMGIVSKKVFNEVILSLQKVLNGLIEEVETRKNAVMYYETTFNYYIPRNYTNPNGQARVHMTKEIRLHEWCGFFYGRNSPLKLAIDRKIFQLDAAGLLKKWERDFYFGNQVDLSSEETEVKVSMNHIQGLLAVLGVGLFLAFISFLVEIIYVKRKSKNNRNQS